MNSSPQIVETLLNLLRRWGWEVGYRKLQQELSSCNQEAGPEVQAFFLAWMAAERGEFDEAERISQQMNALPSLAGWALFVRAYAVLRQKEFKVCKQLLDSIQCGTGDGDIELRAAAAHLRGALYYHQGNADEALSLLRTSISLFGGVKSGHFGVGRVVDTMGMIYASRNNFHAARELFRRSLELKENHGDMAGKALSHGQLGRLYMDWGLWPLAEKHFHDDRTISISIFDDRGQAQMCNALGRLALVQGKYKEAGDWLDAGFALCEGKSHWSVLEGYLRIDRALVCLGFGNTDNTANAEKQLIRAEELFRSLSQPFAEGLAHVNLAWGLLHRSRGQFGDSRQRLQAALRHFHDKDEAVEIARTQLELARTQRAVGMTGAPIREALLDALTTAEKCRRVVLVREIEKELLNADPEAYYIHIYRRVRGRSSDGDATSLIDGRNESITVLFLDIKGSTNFTREHDPAEVMLTLNQLMADLVEVMRVYGAEVNVFRGDGFLALVRGENHARRAVEAALDMNAAIARFNEPRLVLKLHEFATRIGISTGEAFLGNVGTYEKMDFTAIGKAVNLGARLEPAASPGKPCISRATREAVGDRFVYEHPAGREVKAKGFDPELVQVWDVTGRAPSLSS
jgi:class 3 adenylate cyclase/uncharacterized protein HemY